MPTANLGLSLHVEGEAAWYARANDNLDALDGLLAPLVAAQSGRLIAVGADGALVPVSVGFGLQVDSTNPANPVLMVGNMLNLSAIRLLARGSALTLRGFYVDVAGNQLGNVWSLSVPVGNGSNDPVGLPSVPSGAVDARLRVDAAADLVAYYSACGPDGGDFADFKANYANYPSVELYEDSQSIRELGL